MEVQSKQEAFDEYMKDKELSLTENKDFLENLKTVLNEMENLRNSKEFDKYYSPKKGQYYDDKYKIYITAQDQVEDLIQDIEEEINLNKDGK
tara:strand:- start:707 stop:982 length:276 start_codon:yes stop_codon:yes gene_type:complete